MPRPEDRTRQNDKTLTLKGTYESFWGDPKHINLKLTSTDLEYSDAALHCMMDDGDPKWDENVRRIAHMISRAIG